MIKNPKIGQNAFLVDKDHNIISGKITNIWGSGLVEIESFFLLYKKYAFNTRKRAEQYAALLKEKSQIKNQILKLNNALSKLLDKEESFLNDR